ncbi:MAG: hypoxanthine phosphoribosyltransferase [Leptospiraceae bacterium]|nr:hypoxanthine phosphoribosyltransferase [Leptospiraceae bacterium]MDW8306398.1 hypoxanthine phosphoribosyltransferase [Leptospiraceae bacterium]
MIDNPPPLISQQELRDRVRELGEEITKDYQGKDTLRVIGALKGCFVFMADLIREIKIPVRVDFMEVSSYGNQAQTSGNVKIIKDLTHDIAGEHVLFTEDIVDTGLTLNFVMEILSQRNPASLEICALLTKPRKMALRFPVKYRGFEIEDYFVVGYGLDYKGYYRNLPYIGKISSPEQLPLFDEKARFS